MINLKHTLGIISLAALAHSNNSIAQKSNYFFKNFNDSLYNSGMEYLKKNDDVEALKLFNKINTGIPTYDVVMAQKLGIHYRNLNVTEVEKLIADLRLWSGGTHRMANLFEGLTLLDKNDTTGKAIQLFDANMKLTEHKDYTSMFYKGIALMQNKNYDAAIKVFEEYLLVNFLNFDVQYYLAECYLQQGRLSEAMIVLGTGISLTSGGSFENFEAMLNAIAHMAESVQEVYAKRSNTAKAFTESDKFIAAKSVIKNANDAGAEVSRMDWINVLKKVLEMNKVKDGNSIVHQLFLPSFDKQIISNLEYLPYIIYMYKSEEINDYLKLNRKEKDIAVSAREALFKYAFMINGTRILNAAERAKKKKLNYFVINNVLGAVHTLFIYHLQTPITFEELMADKFVGKVELYTDNYLKSITDYSTGNKTIYYDYSNQVFRKWEFKNSANYKFTAYANNGTLIMDEKYEKNELVSLKHFDYFGLPIKQIDYNDNKVTSKEYFGNGKLKAVSTIDKSGKIPALGLDTINIVYYPGGSFKEVFVRDNEKNQFIHHRYYNDAILKTIYYKDNSRDLYRIVDNVVRDEKKISNKNNLIYKEYNETGQLLLESEESVEQFVDKKMKVFTKTGKQYGFLHYESGKLVSGYMLGPAKDTIWSSNKLEADNKLIKVFTEHGILDYTIKLGYDNSLFKEEIQYYANGKKRAYLSKTNDEGIYNFSEIENLYLNGNLKNSGEVIDANSNLYVEREYYTNGNINREVIHYGGNEYRDIKNYYRNGIVASQYLYDLNNGFYGDYYQYNLAGKVRKIETLDNGVLLRVQNFNKEGMLVDYQKVKSGLDTVSIYDASGEKIGYELYNNGRKTTIRQTYYKNNKLKEVVYYSDYGIVDSIASFYVNGALRRTEKYDKKGTLLLGIGREITGEESDKYYYIPAGDYKEYDYTNGVRMVKISDGEELKSLTILQHNDTIFHTTLELNGVIEIKYRNEKNVVVSRLVARNEHKIVAYHTNGSVALELPLLNHIIDGNMVLYYNNKQAALKSVWKDNMFNGAYQWYDNKGRMKEEQYFSYNYPDKHYKYWDVNTGSLLIETLDYGSVNSVSKMWDESEQKMISDED